MFQPQGSYDRNWLKIPLAYVVIKTDGQGMAAEIFMITAVPSPAAVDRSGIYPGVAEKVEEKPKRFIRPSKGYENLCFSFYLLNGEISLDHKMIQTSHAIRSAFPGAIIRTVIFEKCQIEEYNEIANIGFQGFPSVAVHWKNEVIYRHEGLIFSQSLIDEINKMTMMHVVEGRNG